MLTRLGPWKIFSSPLNLSWDADVVWGLQEKEIDCEDRMEKRQKIRECVRTGCGYPPLVSPSKPEVQAQERVCRSFFCVLTKPAAPYLLLGCLYLLCVLCFFPTLLPNLCVYPNISYPLPCLSGVMLTRHSSLSPSVDPPVWLEVRLWQYVDLFLTVACHLNSCHGTSVTTGEKCIEKSCQPEITLKNLPALTEQSGGLHF